MMTEVLVYAVLYLIVGLILAKISVTDSSDYATKFVTITVAWLVILPISLYRIARGDRE